MFAIQDWCSLHQQWKSCTLKSKPIGYVGYVMWYIIVVLLLNPNLPHNELYHLALAYNANNNKMFFSGGDHLAFLNSWLENGQLACDIISTSGVNGTHYYSSDSHQSCDEQQQGPQKHEMSSNHGLKEFMHTKIRRHANTHAACWQHYQNILWTTNQIFK